jgi:conjugal transfer pilin signal peptidase TrbI
MWRAEVAYTLDNAKPKPANLARRGIWMLNGLAAIVLWFALDSYARSHLFLINRSPSLPNWAFIVEKHFGKVPSAFGKIVYGVPGDEIVHRGARVFVRFGPGDDNRINPRSAAGGEVQVAFIKPRSSVGEVLRPGPTGVIPNDCFYMGSRHRDGFDSRYADIGFVCKHQLVGVANKVIL